MPIHGLRYLLGSLLLVAGIAAILTGGWLIWAVAAVMFVAGAPVDEAIGDDVDQYSGAQRALLDASIFATLPLLAFMTLAMLARVAVASAGAGGAIAAVFLSGYCYALFGATVGHELVHRTTSKAAQWCGNLLFAFTFNPGFAMFHVHGHHRAVATLRDPATARRGEYILAFVLRTTIGQFRQALQFAAERERRRGRPAFGPGNMVIRGVACSLALIGVGAMVAGWPGVAAVVAAGLIGRFFHELVNYVQHFGLVRTEGAAVEQRHSWDSHRFLSNTLHYNLPRHADHHMFAAKPFWHLQAATHAPVLPHGYQTMVFVALLPGLWRRTMQPLLADWDARLASEAERALIRARGWDGRC